MFNSFEEQFFVLETIEFLNEHKSCKVALQFPDSLLQYSVRLVSLLRAKTNAEFFILGDTSFGSCCVDEVAASHIKADSIIHYGDACLSRTVRVPVKYIFPATHSAELILLESRLEQAIHSTPHVKEYVVTYDRCFGPYIHAIQETISSLERKFPVLRFILATLQLGDKSDQEMFNCCGFSFSLDKDSFENVAILFIGEECPLLTNLMMTFNQALTVSVPLRASKSPKIESKTVSRSLMRRYYLIEKAKDARIIGILVGTLAVDGYLQVIDSVKKLIRSSGKKHYLVQVGKINDPKLANFSDIDIFVTVSCPYSCLINTYNFVKDIITPFELQIALSDGIEWTGEYKTEFETYLSRDEIQNENTSVSHEKVPRYSMLTGKLVQSSESTSGNVMDLAKRSNDLDMIIVEKQEQRTYKGLEPRIGQDAASEISRGLSGIAKQYEHL